MNALRLAVGTLTACPVPAPTSLAAPVPGRAMALAPLVGLLPGGAAAAVCWAAGLLGWGVAIQATLAVGALALATRGLHLDGLADYADGLAAAYDRDRALAVMRRGDTGPAGLATTVLVLALQVAALAQVLDRHSPTAGARAALLVLLVAVVARLAVPIACRRGVPPARAEGLGATVAGSVHPVTLVALVPAVGSLAAGVVAWSGLPWWQGPLAVVGAVLAACAVVHRARRRFGGVTGDVIGAAVEVAAVAALLTLAAS